MEAPRTFSGENELRYALWYTSKDGDCGWVVCEFGGVMVPYLYTHDEATSRANAYDGIGKLEARIYHEGVQKQI